MDRCTGEGVWKRGTGSRKGSAAFGTDRRQGICNSPPRDQSSTHGIGYEEAQPTSCAGRSRRGETPKNRKIVEGENDLTRFSTHSNTPRAPSAPTYSQKLHWPDAGARRGDE